MKQTSNVMVLVLRANLVQNIGLDLSVEKNTENQVKDWRKIVLQKWQRYGVEEEQHTLSWSSLIKVVPLYVNNMNAWIGNFLQNLLKTIFQKCLVNVGALTGSFFSKMDTLVKTVWQVGKLWNYMGWSTLVFQPKVQASVPQNIFKTYIKQITVGCNRKSITHEVIEQFSKQLMTTVTSHLVMKFDKSIESTYTRVKIIVRSKGEHFRC